VGSHIAKKLNLINLRFGKLLVIREASKEEKEDLNKKNGVWWLCRCNCGNETISKTTYLTQGETQSCGCYRYEQLSKTNKKDLSGQQFYRLLVIEEYGRDKYKSVLWLCQCICAELTVVKTSDLNTGKVRSCGCLQKEIAAKNLSELAKRQVGAKNPVWNSNLSEEERSIGRNYSGYHLWRKSVYERDNYTCQVCGDNKGGNLNAHHLDGYEWCVEKRTLTTNGITLCDRCHKYFHKLFGNKGNTKEQYIKFLEEIMNLNKGNLYVPKKSTVINAFQMKEEFTVSTQYGELTGKPLDYLISTKNGEQYPCDKEIFEESYIMFDDNFAEEYEKALKEMYANPIDPIEEW
jgi:hypothetical protein